MREGQMMLPFCESPGKLTKEQSPFILDGWNESKHKRDKKGRFAEMDHEGIVCGKWKAILGFKNSPVETPVYHLITTSKGHDRSHERHAKEMGITMKQWKQEACSLLNDEEKETYLDWYTPDTGVFRRFDMNAYRLVAGTDFGTINTYFELDKSKLKAYLPDKYLEHINKKR